MQLKHPDSSQLEQFSVHLSKNKEFLMGKIKIKNNYRQTIIIKVRNQQGEKNP